MKKIAILLLVSLLAVSCGSYKFITVYNDDVPVQEYVGKIEVTQNNNCVTLQLNKKKAVNIYNGAIVSEDVSYMEHNKLKKYLKYRNYR